MAKGICSVEGCDRPVRARGWCDTHYGRWRDHGDPLSAPMRERQKGNACSVEGCERPAEKRGWCNSHYKRWARHGSPTGGGTPKLMIPASERFERYTDKNGAVPEARPELGPCWLWTLKGQGRMGHGTISDYPASPTPVGVHRWSYEYFIGPIPAGLEIDHLCRVPRCVNPAHLEAVTHRENMRRSEAWAGKNARKTHCPQGHPYDEENTYWDKKGRQCRACGRQRYREWAARTGRGRKPKE